MPPRVASSRDRPDQSRLSFTNPSAADSWALAAPRQQRNGYDSGSHLHTPPLRAAPPPVALPYHGLSDEILAQIFDELHSSYQEGFGAHVPPPQYLLVSKRLYDIVRPIWLRAISVQGTLADTDRFLAKLLTDPTIWPLVRDLEIEFFPSFAQSQFAILTALANLRRLTVHLDNFGSMRPHAKKQLPPTLLDAIANCPRLEELSFSQHVEAQTCIPKPVNKRPLLSFTAPIHSINKALLEYLTVRRVKKLRLTVFLNYELFVGDLPWDHLTTIVFDIALLQDNDQGITWSVPVTLARQLARTSPHAPPLDVGLVIDPGIPMGKVADTVKAFLDAFAPRRTRIGVRADGNNLVLPVIDRYQKPWDLVESCFLDGMYDLTERRNLAEFAAFLDNMPAVKRIWLLQVKVTAASSSNGPGPTRLPVSALKDDRLALDYPHLGALLAHVANRSKVTLFEIRVPSEPGLVRWGRETAQDPLVRVAL